MGWGGGGDCAEFLFDGCEYMILCGLLRSGGKARVLGMMAGDVGVVGVYANDWVYRYKGLD